MEVELLRVEILDDGFLEHLLCFHLFEFSFGVPVWALN